MANIQAMMMATKKEGAAVPNEERMRAILS